MISLSVDSGAAQFVVGAPVYAASNSTQVALAQAADPERCRVCGLVSPVPSSMTTSVNLCSSGRLGASREQWAAVLASDEENVGTLEKRGRLLLGRTYYLDAWTPGRITSRKPRLPGQWVVEIGVALSGDVLRVDIKPPIRIESWYPFELVTFDPTHLEESPWNRSDWSGRFVCVDDTGSVSESVGDPALLRQGDVRPESTPFTNRSDYVERVLAHNIGVRGDDWQDSSAGIAVLKDGRFVAWESSIDVTGSGFHADAYGGDADILIAATSRAAWLAISEQARELLRFATLPSEQALVTVLYDRYLELRPTRPEKRPATGLPASMLQGELAPDGSDGDGNASVPGAIGCRRTLMPSTRSRRSRRSFVYRPRISSICRGSTHDHSPTQHINVLHKIAARDDMSTDLRWQGLGG